MLEDLDLATFWADSEYALATYVCPQPSDELIAEVQRELGHTLPAAYVAMMRIHNGGVPCRRCFPTQAPTSWAADHVAITGILGIGRDKSCSLCGALGSEFMVEAWGYPRIGIYFADCPSAGHDMIAMDYRACGPSGEPSIAHVDQENGYRITPLAPDFETFVRGLTHESVFED